MYAAQNNKLHSHLPSFGIPKLIKFCYIITALLLYSCGDAKTDNTTKTQTTDNQTETTTAPETKDKTILCFGDSITAGYGLDDTNDAYPGILQQTIDSLNLGYTVINSGVSGETTAGGKSRIDWVIKQKPTVFLLELGANDGLRGVPVSETRANLQAIINVVKTKSPETKIVLAGMQLPPNMGATYTTEFKTVFSDLATENNIAFIPFILEDVGGIASLNQGDGIHPNVKGHKLVANTVWDVLGPLVM
ncbi:GDSL-like lipase/acylhydrolase family protein [Formosa agariphila KMM 3901]|uniref:GDSL-like lipase/acylhydrolase family protein n=1 Tax=Formosa agariphila (strain DSM 15362 / KCTC 12365 / LMG 23005 / KMM 3901 / M-2Alg 35-1) TaxID=1347342 RepID=T2KKL1_FORAG|nr:arylesterase [Formosa agariphila]CDF79285.1 GDSL-like lipase/acylhydrolase family protein [Formosa agariphila KMM 3901]